LNGYYLFWNWIKFFFTNIKKSGKQYLKEENVAGIEERLMSLINEFIDVFFLYLSVNNQFIFGLYRVLDSIFECISLWLYSDSIRWIVLTETPDFVANSSWVNFNDYSFSFWHLGLFKFRTTSDCEKTSVLLSSNITKHIKRFFHILSMHFTSISRKQLRFSSLEDTISPDNQFFWFKPLLSMLISSWRCKIAQDWKPSWHFISKFYDKCVVPAGDRFSRKTGQAVQLKFHCSA
jgi:hypothetical protein